MTADGANGARARRPWADLLHGPDARAAALILALCAGLYYVTTGFDRVPELLNQNIPATWFPRLMLGTIALLALLLPFEHRFLRAGKAGLDAERRGRIRPVAAWSALLLAAIVAAMPYLGTLVAMVLVTLLLPLLWGARFTPALAVFGIAFPVAVALLFTQVLQVYFEPGLLEALLR